MFMVVFIGQQLGRGCKFLEMYPLSILSLLRLFFVILNAMKENKLTVLYHMKILSLRSE